MCIMAWHFHSVHGQICQSNGWWRTTHGPCKCLWPLSFSLTRGARMLPAFSGAKAWPKLTVFFKSSNQYGTLISPPSLCVNFTFRKYPSLEFYIFCFFDSIGYPNHFNTRFYVLLLSNCCQFGSWINHWTEDYPSAQPTRCLFDGKGVYFFLCSLEFSLV